MILGKGGKTIRKLESENEVKIDIQDKKHGSDLQRISVSGKTAQVDEAKREIKALAEKHNEDKNRYVERRQKAEKQVCEHYRRGYCSFGNRCMYSHEPQAAQSTSHNPRDNQSKRLYTSRKHRSRSPVARR